MAGQPTIHIIASDAHRNGKTLLARLIVDYLLLGGRDPFIIDTDAPDGPLRGFFPGRTLLADFAEMAGQMKTFDTILAAPGRDYVVDLPQRHLEPFLAAVKTLDFFTVARAAGFAIKLFFVVDRQLSSQRAALAAERALMPDLFIAVRNAHVGSSWPVGDGAIDLPAMPQDVAFKATDKRFALGRFMLGDRQGLAPDESLVLNRFLVEVLQGLGGVETELKLE